MAQSMNRERTRRSAVVMRAWLGALLVALAALSVHGQGPSPKAPEFEVASVKQNVSGDGRASIQVPPAGALAFINVPLRILIRDAYEVDAYTERFRLIPGPFARLVGTPGARDSGGPRFDVRAKPPDGTAPRERRAMMRALLEDRFKLRVHRDTRQMPVYALTAIREGRLGPNLKRSAFDCEAYFARRRAGAREAEPVDALGRSWCPLFVDHSRPGVENFRSAGPVRLLLQRLQPYVDRPIVDATGLTGNIEWDLTFAIGPEAAAEVPTLVTAVQEQLGLKLEARQAPLDVLVVDHVEMPTPD